MIISVLTTLTLVILIITTFCLSSLYHKIHIRSICPSSLPLSAFVTVPCPCSMNILNKWMLHIVLTYQSPWSLYLMIFLLASFFSTHKKTTPTLYFIKVERVIALSIITFSLQVKELLTTIFPSLFNILRKSVQKAV